MPHTFCNTDMNMAQQKKTLRLLKFCNKGKKNGLLGNTIHTHAP
jgi:hypothetical protein